MIKPSSQKISNAIGTAASAALGSGVGAAFLPVWTGSIREAAIAGGAAVIGSVAGGITGGSIGASGDFKDVAGSVASGAKKAHRALGRQFDKVSRSASTRKAGKAYYHDYLD